MVPGLDEDQQKTLLAERLHRMLGSDSKVLEAAYVEAFRLISIAPRNAKRLLNRLRLYIFMLFDAGILQGDFGVTGKHVGKWAALQEGWPEVTSQVRLDPSVMGILESVASTDQFDAVIKASVPSYRVSSENTDSNGANH
jgi:hypothetical protein